MDHRKEAETLLCISSETSNRTLGSDCAAVAVAHALLDVADAIREQTESLKTDGVVHRTGWRADRA